MARPSKNPATPRPKPKTEPPTVAEQPKEAKKPLRIPATRFRVTFKSKGTAIVDGVAADIYRRKARVLSVEAIE